MASTSQSEEPWPCWKTNTTIPKAAASETRFSSTALIGEHDRAERPGEQDQRQHQDEREHVGEAVEQGVQEVAVDRGDAGQRAVGPLERGVGAIDDRLDAGGGAVDRGERLDQRVRAAVPGGGAVAPTTPGTVRSLAAIVARRRRRARRARRAASSRRG